MAAARGLKFVLSLSLYTFLALIPLSQMHAGADHVVTWKAALALALGCAPLVSVQLGLIVLGACCCVLPVFGPGALTLFICAWLSAVELRMFLVPALGSESNYPNKELAGIGCFFFLIAYGSSAINTLLRSFDGALVRSVFRAGGFESLALLLISTHVPWVEAFQMLGVWVLTFCLVYAVAACDRYLRERALLETGVAEESNFGARSLLLGFGIGMCIALAFVTAQVGDIRPWSRMNRSAYFSSLLRYAGTFSDPNAFGVCAIILTPLFLGFRARASWIYKLLALVLVIGVQLSGSRTFWLGAAVWLLYAVYRAWVSRRWGRIPLAISIIVYPTLFVLLGEPSVNEQLQKAFPTAGVTRTLNTIHWAHMRQMLGARALFTGIALEVARQSPLVGVGVGRFVDEEGSAAVRLGTALGSWRDNANNFYLHALAEQGALGLLLTLVSFYLLTKAISGPNIFDQMSKAPAGPLSIFRLGRIVLGVSALLLLSGPHIFFDEVRYLLAILYGFCLSNIRPQSFSFLKSTKRGAYAVAFAFPAIYSFFALSDPQMPETYGLYPPETLQGETIVWTAQNARFPICYDQSGEVVLRIRLLHPDLLENPVHTTVRLYDQPHSAPVATRDLTTTNSDWTEVRVPLPPNVPPVLHAELDVDRIWSPRKLGMSQDPRWLGAMISWQAEGCSVQ